MHLCESLSLQLCFSGVLAKFRQNTLYCEVLIFEGGKGAPSINADPRGMDSPETVLSR